MYAVVIVWLNEYVDTNSLYNTECCGQWVVFKMEAQPGENSCDYNFIFYMNNKEIFIENRYRNIN
jgi:hypothetical protein